MMKLNYVATITYTSGTHDVIIMRAKDLGEAWKKVTERALTGEVHVRSIEVNAAMDEKDLR